MRMLCLALAATVGFAFPASARPVAITGATLVDVSQFGRSAQDIVDAVVVIENGKIIAAGPASEVKAPAGARRIDARGAFLVPGLIDGFGALRDQGFANAFLFEGVTTVFLPDATGGDERRGKGFLTANPSPHVFVGGSVTGYSPAGESVNDTPAPPGAGPDVGGLTRERLTGDPITRAQVEAHVQAVATAGARAIWIDYDVWPYQVDSAVRATAALHMGTIGELGFTAYPYAIRAGVATFVHSQRYLSALATPIDQLRYADDPFGTFSAASAAAIKNECTVDPASPLVAAFGAQLAESKSTLMPTLGMEANLYAMDGAPNPWKRPAAKLISTSQLHEPIDPQTNRPAWYEKATSAQRTRLGNCFHRLLDLDHALHAAGARYLAASGTSAFGVLPGGGMHRELALLVDFVGLTPREALAAATSNYADAFGWTDVGRIEPGRFADILILNQDPRTSVAALDSIRSVILAGESIDRAKLLTWRPPAGK